MGKRKSNKSRPRYRKISVQMYADEKYRRLTAPPPCGQVLWWHLLAGEQTDIIPGLMKIGELAFAEQLGWTLKGFREAFREVLREGLAEADWQARLVWVPNAIKHNLPESPNVVKAWRVAWPHIPECALKEKAYLHIENVLKVYGEAYAEAFRKGCGLPSAKAYAKAYGNQEQEQEQEQEVISFNKEITEPSTTRFQKPTIEEVRAYCVERGNNISAEQWYDYYTSKGWKIGRTPMKDWKASVRNWERNDYNKKPSDQPVKQRVYTDEEIANLDV